MRYYSAACLKVKDYNQFKKEFDAAQDLLRSFGCKQSTINRDVDNPNQLLIIHEFENLQRAREFYKSPEFQQCIAKAGIVGKPDLMFLEELARTQELVSV